MRTFVAYLVFALFVWQVGWRIFRQAGNPGTRPGRGKTPKGVDELRNECGDRLPSEVYRVFERAVLFHRRKEYGSALEEYERLRRIPYRGGQVDLYKISAVFKHNWDIITKAIKR